MVVVGCIAQHKGTNADVGRVGVTRVSDLGNGKVSDVTEGLDPSQESRGGTVDRFQNFIEIITFILNSATNGIYTPPHCIAT